MAKRKTDAAEQLGSDIQPNDVVSPPDQAAEAEKPADKAATKWAARLQNWIDVEAGVEVIDDRENRRMIVKFAEKPSEPVRTFVKRHPFGFKLDDEEMLWYKRIHPAKPRQIRSEAEELAFEAASMIRQEKGLPAKKRYSLAPS